MSDEPLLGQICLAIVDCEHKTVPVSESGDAWAIGTPAMIDGRIDFSKAKQIDDDVYSKWTRRMVPAEGDLILAREAPVGPVVRVPRFPRVALGQRTVLLRPDPKIVNDRYLHYLLLSAEVQNRMHAKSEGSTVRHLNVEDVRNLPIPVLPLISQQECIADVLGALDDKIESNRRLCGVVDGLVRAELENLADLPSSEKITVGELAERIHKPADPQKLPPSTNYIGLEHMPRGLMILDEWGTAEGLDSGKSHFEEADVLFGKLRPNFRKVGVTPVSGICSTDILVLRPQSGFSTALLLAVVSSEQVLGPAIAASSGTKMPRISWDYIAELRVQIPDEIGRREFSDRVDPMIQRVLKAVRETQILTETRGALLPELLSGRLRVSDAEKVVEGAV